MLRAGLAAMALAAAGAACADEGWSGAATLQWTASRTSEDFATFVATADHDALHLEGRANYEAIHAQSAFAGWTFSTGDAVKLEATPMAGFVGGALRGPIAGLEATVSAGPVDYYIEAEHVWDKSDREASYTYVWTTLGYRPSEEHWAHFGVVAQRTRIYGGEREIQRGPFLELTWRKLTFGGYWFNPGSSQQVVIGSVALSF
jgi:hypothetical protein